VPGSERIVEELAKHRQGRSLAADLAHFATWYAAAARAQDASFSTDPAARCAVLLCNVMEQHLCMRRAESMPLLVRQHSCAELSLALRTRQSELHSAPITPADGGSTEATRCLPEVAAAGWHLARAVDDCDAKLMDFAGAQSLIPSLSCHTDSCWMLSTAPCAAGDVLSVAGALPPHNIAFHPGILPDPLAAVPRARLAAGPPASPSKAPASAETDDDFLQAALQLLATYLLDTEVSVIRIAQNTIRHALLQEDCPSRMMFKCNEERFLLPHTSQRHLILM